MMEAQGPALTALKSNNLAYNIFSYFPQP